MTAHATIDAVHEPSARSGAAYATPVDASSVASGLPARERRSYAPGELVSLWDMLRFQAHVFVGLMKTLQKIELSLDESQQRLNEANLRLGFTPAKAQESAVNDSGDEATKILRERLREEWRLTWEALRPHFDAAEQACITLEADSALDQINRIRQQFGKVRQVGDLAADLRQLAERIEDQLQRRTFFFVPPDRAKYFVKEPPPFGEAVREKFSEATADVEDAGACLGFGRSTASVYHLMCVVEFGIKRIARRLKIKKLRIEHKTWGAIFDLIDPKVAALPYSSPRERARRDELSEALVFLKRVKDAWRNPTMHSRRRYTQDEAEDVFQTVKSFMHYLATKRF